MGKFGTYWRIYKQLLVSSIAKDLEYRENFVAKLLQNLVGFLFYLLTIYIVFANVEQVAGWKAPQFLILMGTCFFIDSIHGTFCYHLSKLPELVRRGELDFVLIKPISSQFWVTFREFDFSTISLLIVSVIAVGMGVSASGVTLGILQILGYLVLTMAAILMFFAVRMIMMTTAVWFIDVSHMWVLSDTMMSIARFPTDIYGTNVRRIFIYYLPLAFIATIPAKQLIDGFSMPSMLHGILWAVIFWIASKLFWNFALKHYSSASS